MKPLSLRQLIVLLCCLFGAACSGGGTETGSSATPAPVATPAPTPTPAVPATPKPADVTNQNTPLVTPPPVEAVVPVAEKPTAVEQPAATPAAPIAPTDPAPTPTPSEQHKPVPPPKPPAFSQALTIAGKPGGCGHADGTGSDARVWEPTRLVGDGKIFYMAESIRTISRVTVDSATGAHTVQGFASLTYLDQGTLRSYHIVDIALGTEFLYVLTSNNDHIWEHDGQLWALPLAAPLPHTTPTSEPVLQFNAPRAMVSVEGALYVLANEDDAHFLPALFTVNFQGATPSSAKVLSLPGINAYSMTYAAANKTIYISSQPSVSGKTGQGRVWAVNAAGITEVPKLVLNYPHRVSVSLSGQDLLIIDTAKNIVRYRFADQTTTTLLTNGPAVVDGTLGVAGTARVSQPRAILPTDDTHFYVGDACTLRQAQGEQFVTVAGSPKQSGFASGAGTAARFTNPQHVAVTPDGALVYVTDFQCADAGKPPCNQVLRQVEINNQNPVPVATVLPDTIPLVDPITKQSLNITDLVVIPNPAFPRLFVTSRGNLYYVAVDTKTLHRIPLRNAAGALLQFFHVAFDTEGRLVRLGVGGDADVLVTGLATAALDSAPEYNGTDVALTLFTLDPEQHLQREDYEYVYYNADTDTFLASTNPASPNGTGEFRLLATGDAAQPVTAQWQRTWTCEEETPGLLTNGAFAADAFYLPGRATTYQNATAINRCRADGQAPAVVTVSGTSDQGVKDGVGALGHWSNPADMTYDRSHHRFYIIDAGENVLRVLQ